MIYLDEFQDLTESELKELDFKMGDRKKLQKII